MKMTVKAWRQAKDISQDEMSKKLGIHVNTYQSWEKNTEDISIKNAYKISFILGVSLDDITFIEEEEIKWLSTSIEKEK